MINIKMPTAKHVQRLSPVIFVVGCGGAGGNAIDNMIASDLEGCQFIACNADAQALENSRAPIKVQLGAHVTGGLGAGSKPDIGKAAAEESLEEVMSHLEGANMVFITAGMGGGTGTGSAPVVARACRERGILTVGVVTKPFHFEGTHRMRMAEAGIKEMQDYVDTLIVIPNQNLFRIANEKIGFAEAFRMVDGVLQSGVRGVTDLMVSPGLINLDFADIRTAMMEMGKALMGTGEAMGDKRAIEAAEAAINNPLLDDVSMKGALGVIINVTGGHDMTLFEVDEACNRIRDEVDPDANIIFGATFDESLEGIMRVSIVATGIEKDSVQVRRTGGASLKTDARGKSTLERAQPKTEAQPIAATAAPSFMPAQTSRAFTAPTALAQQPRAAFPAPSGSARAPEPVATQEPEEELFEQSEFKATETAADPAKNTALRGARYKDAFIPPPPIEAQTEDDQSFGVIPSRPSYQSSSATPQVLTSHAMTSSLQLNPPRMQVTEKKRSPSLFERITGAAIHTLEGLREEPTRSERSAPAPSSPSMGGGYAPQRPMQGSLAIDVPAGKPRQAEENELDIPAFLRRQAN